MIPLKGASELMHGLIGEIDRFERETGEAQYTDTGEAWDLLNRIREYLNAAVKTADEAHRVLNRLVEEDVTRTCLRCGKDEWGADEHEEGCLLREAYVVLGDLDREQESS